MIHLLLTLAAAAEPLWSIDLDRAARLAPTDAGIVVAALPDRVVAIDARTGGLAWERDVGEVVTADLVRAVPGGRYLQLSRIVAGDDTFEVLDVYTGASLWTAEEGRVLLDVFAHDADAFVLTDRRDAPGTFELHGLSGWSAPVRGAPAILPARPGRGVQTYSARANPGPLFLDDGFVTAWSPHTGIARRDRAGEVVWRVLLPGAERLLPASGHPDLLLQGDLIVVPQRDRQVTALGLDGTPRWAPGRGRAKASIRAVAASPMLVWTAAGPYLEALSRPDGRRIWRQRGTADLVALLALNTHVAALDADDTLVVVDPLGVERSRFALDLGADPTLVQRGDLLVVAHSRGVVAVRPWAGTVAWEVAATSGVDLTRPTPTANIAQPSWMDRRGLGPYHFWVEGDRVHRTHLGTGVDRVIDTGGSAWVADRTGKVLVVQRPGGLLEGHTFEPLPVALSPEEWSDYDERGFEVVEIPIVPTDAVADDAVTIAYPYGVAPSVQTTLHGVLVAASGDTEGGWAQVAVPLEVAGLVHEALADGAAFEIRR